MAADLEVSPQDPWAERHTTGHPCDAGGVYFSNQAFIAEGGSWPEWHEHVMLFLMNQQQYVFGKFDIAAVVDNVKQDCFVQ